LGRDALAVSVARAVQACATVAAVVTVAAVAAASAATLAPFLAVLVDKESLAGATALVLPVLSVLPVLLGRDLSVGHRKPERGQESCQTEPQRAVNERPAGRSQSRAPSRETIEAIAFHYPTPSALRRQSHLRAAMTTNAPVNAEGMPG
jgi:hypothetical protein